MSTEMLIALCAVGGAVVYLFWPTGGPVARKGGHGVALLNAAEAAGKAGAGALIEERLGAAAAKQFMRAMTEGMVDPAAPQSAASPASPPAPNA